MHPVAWDRHARALLVACAALGVAVVLALSMIEFLLFADSSQPPILSSAGGAITSPRPGLFITDSVRCPGTQACPPNATAIPGAGTANP